MAGEDLNSKLSGADIKKFGETLSKFDASIARQEEIVKKVLSIENDIAAFRLGALKPYFDAYSKGLDAIIAKKASQLSEAFLAAEAQAEKYLADSKKDDSSDGTADAAKEAEEKRAIQEALYDAETEAYNNALKEQLEKAEEIEKAKSNNAQAEIERYIKFAAKSQEEYYNELEKFDGDFGKLKALRDQEQEKRQQKLANSESALANRIAELYNLQHQDQLDKDQQLRAARIQNANRAVDAEISAQERLNAFKAEASMDPAEAGALRARMQEAEALENYVRDLQDKRTEYIKKRELELALKNNGELTAEDYAQIQKEANDKYKVDLDKQKKLAAEKKKLEAAKAKTQERAELRNLANEALHAGTTTERFEAMKKLTTNDEGNFDLKKTMTAAVLVVSDFAKQLKGTIDDIASYKTAIDTRLYGSNNETSLLGSHWDQLVDDMTSIGAINPFFKQADFAKNIKDLVDRGIAFDLKQRAFLMTIQDKIATTFEVADGTLLRLIRIQQEDSTAGRMGMEAALNEFLNNMYENTEYLKQVADGVRNSLAEMEALMSGAEAAEVEYQVQKWLGSLYSVGMSQNAVQGISDALGKIAAGQIEGLTGSGAGNLLIMAANDAGIPIADILTRGITSEETNVLLQAAVNYLSELADSAKDNQVVQQQLADVFGVKASDLRAASNLVLPGTTKDVFGSSMSYGDMMSQLSMMAGSMGSRVSIAQMMTNIAENGKYTLAGGMASNPIAYLIYNMAGLLDDAVGGIDLPFLNVMGFGVDLNTSVAELMRVGAMSAGILGNLGPMISGLGSSFSGEAMLRKLGIGAEDGNNLAVTPRGDMSGISRLKGGGTKTTSGSAYIGNASGSDIKDSTIQESEDSKEQQMIEAKEEEEANQVNVLNNTVIKIYELLDAVASGKSSFSVKVDSYGLTRGNSSNASALGGVDALASAASATGGSFGASGNGVGSVNSGGVGVSIDHGGWVMA